MSPTTAIAADSPATTPADLLVTVSTDSLSDDHRLNVQAEELWDDTANWRETVEDIVDAVLLRVSSIELSKIRSTWTD